MFNALTADPDLSNPTRPRMERPLDTIRSFEAAIDGSYSRRASFRAGTTYGLHMTSPQITTLIDVCTESTNPLSPQNNRRSGYFSGEITQIFTLPVARIKLWLLLINPS